MSQYHATKGVLGLHGPECVQPGVQRDERQPDAALAKRDQHLGREVQPAVEDATEPSMRLYTA